MTAGSAQRARPGRTGRGIALAGLVVGALLAPWSALAASGWPTPDAIDSYSLLSVSCPSESFCAAVDSNGRALIYNGASWSTPASIDGTNQLSSVSCDSELLCFAIDTTGNAVRYYGHSWGPPASIDGTNQLNSVSCYSSSLCAAVDQNGNVLTYDAGTWSAPAAVDQNALDSVSCASVSFCVAVDYGGNALTYDGSTWSAPASIDGTNPLNSVSCASALFCVAVDQQGNALVASGGAWSAPVDVDGGQPLQSVSCSSASFCAAVDQQGNALTYSDRVWSKPADVDGTETLYSVSCGSASFCVVADDLGQVLSYPPGTPPAGTKPPSGTPVISHFRISPSSIEAGSQTQLVSSFELSQNAGVQLVLAVKRTGRRVMAKCVAQTYTNALAPQCSRYVAFGGSGLRVSGTAGPDTLSLSPARIRLLTGGSSQLKPGSYRLEGTPSVGGSGPVLTGQPLYASFTVTRPKKLLVVIQPVKVTGSGTLKARWSSGGGCVSSGTESFHWSTSSGAFRANKAGVYVASLTSVFFGARGTLAHTWASSGNCTETTQPPSFYNGSCGPDQVTWAMHIDLRLLPDPRVYGGPVSGESSCLLHDGDPSGKALFALYVSSHGRVMSGLNKLKCKHSKGKITSCKAKPNSTLKILGQSSSALCQTRSLAYGEGGRCLVPYVPRMSWDDRETWNLQLKFSAPKCYEVVPGKPRKKVSCPKA